MAHKDPQSEKGMADYSYNSTYLSTDREQKG